METLVFSAFGALCFVAFIVKQYSKNNSKNAKENGIEDYSDESKYKKLKWKFFSAYFLALFGDWLQGPYVYQVGTYGRAHIFD